MDFKRYFVEEDELLLGVGKDSAVGYAFASWQTQNLNRGELFGVVGIEDLHNSIEQDEAKVRGYGDVNDRLICLQ